MAQVQNKDQIQYTNSAVAMGNGLVPLSSKRVTYMRYKCEQLQFGLGYRQGLVFILGDGVDKSAAAASLRDAIPSTLADKLEIRDFLGNLFCSASR